MKYVKGSLSETEALVKARLVGLNPLFLRMWEAALPHQDKRSDTGHALIVTAGVLEIMELISGIDHMVAIPAAMLHDTGWSLCTEDQRLESYTKHHGKDSERAVRLLHQVFGVELAYGVLREVGYPAQYIPEILIIISQHDTRGGEWMGLTGAVVRDADKVPWRVHPVQLEATRLNHQWTTAEQVRAEVDKMAGNIEKPNFLLLEASRQIGRKALNQMYRPAAEQMIRNMFSA